ncbi:MAG TPA: ImpA family metalloprotease [Actinokineospora sp.]|nr:ImpA family metalloprotease [Actinokineospora sp.]
MSSTKSVHRRATSVLLAAVLVTGFTTSAEAATAPPAPTGTSAPGPAVTHHTRSAAEQARPAVGRPVPTAIPTLPTRPKPPKPPTTTTTPPTTTTTTTPPAKQLVAVETSTIDSTIDRGATAQYIATARYSDNSTTDVSTQATWSTGDAAIATVSASGQVTGVGPGTTDVTARYGGFSGALAVTVIESGADRMKRALATGDPRIVSQQELLAQVGTSLDKRESVPFKLIPDGTTVSWWLGTDTSQLGSLTPYQQALLIGTKNLKASTAPNKVLASVGKSASSETSLAYFAANPFVTFPAAGGANRPMDEPGMAPIVENTMAWLLGKAGTAAADLTGSVVVANTNSGRHTSMRSFLSQHFPKLVVNGGNATYGACDFTAAAPSPCLAGATALLVGDKAYNGDPQIRARVRAAYAGGTPLLLFTEQNSTDSLTVTLLRELGIDAGTNYFQQNAIENLPKSAVAPGPVVDDELAKDAREIVRRLGGASLELADYSACLGADLKLIACVDKPVANAAAYMGALTRMKARLKSAHAAGTDYFAPATDNQNETMRVLILLADKQRNGTQGSERPDDNAVAISYPIDQRDPKKITQALFADWFVTTTWSGNSRAADYGTVWCVDPKQVNADTCPAPVFPPQQDRSVALKSTTLDEWTATGFDLIPGQAGTVTLTADPGIPVYVRTFPTKASTRSGEVDSTGVSKYNRPQYVATDWVRLTPGAAKTLSSPYGGPLYIRMDGTNRAAGIQVNVDFDKVSQHPVVLDMDNEAQLERFAAEIATTTAHYTDLVGVGFEFHPLVASVRKSLASGGVSAAGLTAYYTGGAAGVRKLLQDVRDAWYKQEMRMAGYKLSDQTLEESLPVDVKAICATYQWPCTDPAINSRTTVQHFNYDVYASCGSLCSGNPIDAGDATAIVPFGWGEAHELGHNLQRKQLDVHWADTANGGNPGAADSWGNYVSRAGENSNNIFPQYVQWTFARITRPARGDGTVNDPLTSHDPYAFVRLFAAHQSAANNLVKDGKRVIMDQDCAVAASYPTTATAKSTLADAIWGSSAYAANNDVRMAFYLGLPLLMEGKQLADGTTLASGPNIYTVLYGSARTFSAWSKDEPTWTANRAKLGFSLYPFTGSATYGGKTVPNMIGNDFMLVQLSRVTGYDFRPYFDAHGVYYTTLASQQVDANGGLKPLANLMPVLGKFQPGLSLGGVRHVDVVGAATLWPGIDVKGTVDADYVDFSPTKCAGVTSQAPVARADQTVSDFAVPWAKVPAILTPASRRPTLSRLDR